MRTSPPNRDVGSWGSPRSPCCRETAFWLYGFVGEQVCLVREAHWQPCGSGMSLYEAGAGEAGTVMGSEQSPPSHPLTPHPHPPSLELRAAVRWLFHNPVHATGSLKMLCFCSCGFLFKYITSSIIKS